MQLTTRGGTLKRWTVQGDLRPAATPQAVPARAAAHSPPEMAPLSCKLHLKSPTSMQVFVLIYWLVGLFLFSHIGRCF